MDDFLTRLKVEQEQLQDKIDKLSPFIGTENFMKLPEVQKVLLHAQLSAMRSYNTILVMRLQNLNQ